MTEFMPFALPDIGDSEIEAVVRAIRSGWVTTGPVTKQFETDFAAYIGGNVEAIAVNSATAGLHLALEALGVGPGDEVITTTYTFTATAEVVRYLGADPVFIDIDESFNIDVAKIEEKITARTKAIIPVHFAGLACDMAAIKALANKYKLHIVEDAAHALPTKYDGRLIGSLDSDITVFSFYATKTITTGEGGMIVTRNSELAKRMKTMRLHGINRDAFDRYTSTKPSWYYEVVAPGYKYNLTDIASAMGVEQLKKADRFFEQRYHMVKVYQQRLAHLPILLPVDKMDARFQHAWHLFVIQLDPTINRDEFILRMAEQGIGTSVHFIPLHMQPYWRDRYNLKNDDFPIATKIYSRAVSLPLYTKMTSQDQERVIAAIEQILVS